MVLMYNYGRLNSFNLVFVSEGELNNEKVRYFLENMLNLEKEVI
jgi:hypothetical protein